MDADENFLEERLIQRVVLHAGAEFSRKPYLSALLYLFPLACVRQVGVSAAGVTSLAHQGEAE